MYIAVIFIVVFFAVIGLAAFIGGLVKAHLCSHTEGFILLVPYVDEDNAEARIRSAAMMTEASRDCRIVCVCDENDPARAICEKMTVQYPQIEIVNEYSEI